MSIPTVSRAELQVNDSKEDQMTPEVMKTFVSHLKDAAALRVSREVCAARHQVALRDYEKTRVHFQRFPPLKEKANINKREAERELQKLDGFIQTSNQDEEGIATILWHELSKAMNGKLDDLAEAFAASAATHMEDKFVPRDRFEALERKHELLLRRLDRQQESIEKLSLIHI